jgi:hypothetical protein
VDRPGEEAAVRIQLGELSTAADLLQKAASATAAKVRAGGDGGDGGSKTVSASDANLRARCLLASAAQQYLDAGGADFPEVQALLGEAAKAFKTLGDWKGELRAKREGEVVKGLRSAYDNTGNSTTALTEALTSLGHDRDGWGVALLVQATPAAARTQLGHEGWQGAITAVAETAEALLRAGGVQSNVRAAAVAKAGAMVPVPVPTGMRQIDREVLETAMDRLRLTDDEVNLAGQFVFEPSLNPWLGAALAQAQGAEGEPGADAPGLDEGISATAALKELQTQAIPGQTLGRMTAKAPLCVKQGLPIAPRSAPIVIFAAPIVLFQLQSFWF